MPNTKKVLDWSFNSFDFIYAAKNILTKESKDKIRIATQSLDKINENLPDGGELPSRLSIFEVYNLFIKNYTTPSFSMSRKDTRYFVWALDFEYGSDEIIILSDKLQKALELIQSNWRDSFIISLWHVLLKNWEGLHDHKNWKIFTDFIKNRAKEYSGARSNILKVTENTEFFLAQNSPEKYAKMIDERSITLSCANRLFNYKENILTYNYFAKVAYSYLNFSDVNRGTVDGVYDFLLKHNSNKTTLLTCAKILNENIFDDYITTVISETVNLISDPMRKSSWQRNDLTVQEQEYVERSRRRLNVLLNKEFIEVFFEQIVEDPRREAYWLRFINDIEDIIIVGNRSNFNFLKEIESISNQVAMRYKVTERNQHTCALVMYIKGYVFAEFSDVGALYVYKKETFDTEANLNSINSIHDLKMWSTYKYACRVSSQYRYLELEEEGRITHQGQWERRVDAWMRRYL